MNVAFHRIGGNKMLYKVRAILIRKVNGNSSIVSFEKEVGAANEIQACKFMIEALKDFVAEDVTIETEIVTEE